MDRIESHFSVSIALGIFFVLIHTSNGLASTITVSDGTFNPSDWTHSPIEVRNGASFATNQAASGGNPGAYQAGTIFMPRPDSFVEAGHLYTGGATYEPSTQGSISSIDVSLDVKITFVSNAGEDMGIEALVQQDDSTYTAFLSFSSPIASGWVHVGPVELTANNFTLRTATGPLPLGPDFTTSGTALMFGYTTWHGRGLDGDPDPSSQGWGVDNFNVVLNTIPEPSTFVLGLTGIAAVAAALFSNTLIPMRKQFT